MRTLKIYWIAVFAFAVLSSCDDEDTNVKIYDPATAEKVSVDRFSSTAGHLMVRTSSNGLPAMNAAINFDQAPFITKGKGPNGQNVKYYNFDVQHVVAAAIYVLFEAGQSSPFEGQLNIIDALPGEIWVQY